MNRVVLYAGDPPLFIPTPFLHYDAIDNAGVGIHNPTATVWKDLAGNNDGTITLGDGSRTENKLKTTKTRVSFDSSGINLTEYTIFSIFSPVFTGTHPRLTAEPQFPTFYLSSGQSYAYGYFGQGIDTIFPWRILPIQNQVNYATFRCRNRKIELFVDWENTGSALTPNILPAGRNPAYLGARDTNDRFLTGAYHSFRIYNRALTDEQIKQLVLREKRRYPN